MIRAETWSRYASTVGFERATTTTIEYSLPEGRYTLAWLDGPSGVSIGLGA